MLLKDLQADNSRKMAKINKTLREQFGFTLASTIETGKLNKLYTKIADDLYNLKLNLSGMKDKNYVQKLLVAEGLKIMMENKRQEMNVLRESHLAGPGARRYNAALQAASADVEHACSVGDDYEEAIKDAMKDYRSSELRFPDEMFEFDLREMTKSCTLDAQIAQYEGPADADFDMEEPINELSGDLLQRAGIKAQNRVAIASLLDLDQTAEYENERSEKFADAAMAAVTRDATRNLRKAPGKFGRMARKELGEDAGHSILDVITPEELNELRSYVSGDVDPLNFIGTTVYEKLFEYYLNSGEMPYGVAKARTGDPDQWILDRVQQDYAEEVSALEEGKVGDFVGRELGQYVNQHPMAKVGRLARKVIPGQKQAQAKARAADDRSMSQWYHNAADDSIARGDDDWEPYERGYADQYDRSASRHDRIAKGKKPFDTDAEEVSALEEGKVGDFVGRELGQYLTRRGSVGGKIGKVSRKIIPGQMQAQAKHRADSVGSLRDWFANAADRYRKSDDPEEVEWAKQEQKWADHEARGATRYSRIAKGKKPFDTDVEEAMGGPKDKAEERQWRDQVSQQKAGSVGSFYADRERKDAEKKANKPPMRRARFESTTTNRKENMKEGYVKQLRKLLEAEVEQAESLIAARGFSQELQDMVEKLGRLVNEDLPAVSEQMRDAYGADVATGFENTVGETLSSVMDSLKGSKQEIDNSVAAIADGQTPSSATDMGDTDFGDEGEFDLEGDADLELPDMDDSELELDMDEPEGTDDELLGRAKKESVNRKAALKKQLVEMQQKLARIKAKRSK